MNATTSDRVEIALLAERWNGERIDRALVAELETRGFEVSRSQLAQSFQLGEVWIQAARVKASFRIERDVVVALCLPQPTPLAHAFAEAIPIDVMYEDESLLVVNKAAGMVVHAGAGHSSGTLVNAILHHLNCTAEQLPVLAGNGQERPGVVHRLDRDTSGVMVFAKNVAAQERLAAQFRAHSIGRRYVAVVRGIPNWSARRVETFHGRDPKDRRRFSPDVSRGRRAISNFQCVEKWGVASLWYCQLETGRTHQIRMHARHLGHPILGDELYGIRARDPGLRRIEGELGRQALHAQFLAFMHPESGEEMRFEAQLPGDLQACVEALRSSS